MVVAEELVDHKSSSGAKRAAGCATSSDREINVELDAVVLVVLVVVLLARRPPSCLLRRVKTPASFTEPPLLGVSVGPDRCRNLVLAWDDSQMRTKINPPTRSVARKKDPELQPITASLLISISNSVILTEAPK